MKSISSAIVVLAGIYGISASMPILVLHSSLVALIAFLASGVALALGLIAWWAALKHEH